MSAHTVKLTRIRKTPGEWEVEFDSHSLGVLKAKDDGWAWVRTSDATEGFCPTFDEAIAEVTHES